MRKTLDGLYRTSGALAAFFLLSIFLIVLLQVLANVVNALSSVFLETSLGLSVPSYAEFAGFFLAASAFLALAHTLQAGSHIRVSLLIGSLDGFKRQLLEAWCSGSGAGLAAYFAYHAIGMTVESFNFSDLSPGLVPVPLWLPQSAMSLGLIILTVALVDRFWSTISGADEGSGAREPSIGGQ